MKTPREILLEEHRDAEPDLDAIRRRAVNRACQGAEGRPLTSMGTWVRLVWDQLFVPSRPAWLSLAAAWVVVATLSLAQIEPRSAGDGGYSARQTFLSLKPLLEEEAQFRVELLRPGNSLPPKDAPVGVATYPRSSERPAQQIER
jgi:hypothetical protein